jgi:hypothetical protein
MELPYLIMFSDPTLAVVNIILLLGIVVALLLALGLKKANHDLHKKNVIQRKRLDC